MARKVPEYAKPENRAEFIGLLIDIFEDFLEEKGVAIENPERDEDGDPQAAIIYGSDYGNLSEDIEDALKAWGVLE